MQLAPSAERGGGLLGTRLRVPGVPSCPSGKSPSSGLVGGSSGGAGGLKALHSQPVARPSGLVWAHWPSLPGTCLASLSPGSRQGRVPPCLGLSREDQRGRSQREVPVGPGPVVMWQDLPWVCWESNLLQLNPASRCSSGVSGGLRPSRLVGQAPLHGSTD